MVVWKSLLVVCSSMCTYIQITLALCISLHVETQACTSHRQPHRYLEQGIEGVLGTAAAWENLCEAN